MKSLLHLFGAALAMGAALVVATDDTCEGDDSLSSSSLTSDSILVADTISSVVSTDSAPIVVAGSSSFSDGSSHVFRPRLRPGTDRHDLKYTQPRTNVSLFYGSDTTNNSAMRVNHTMRYPTVVLEKIAFVSGVDCTNTSVAVTFNDTSVFDETRAAWSAAGKFVMITNHLGDCDVELERGFFTVEAITFDNATMIATASSTRNNVSETASETVISFGGVTTSGGLTRRATGDASTDPTFEIEKTFTLPPFPESQAIYTGDFVTVTTTETATLTGDATFSGYLKYNWITWKVKELWFDIDATINAEIALQADITISASETFTYEPTLLYYGVSVPGLLELGPQLKFGVTADVGATAEATVTAALEADITKGFAHVDMLSDTASYSSGWSPVYNAKVNVSGTIEAHFNPAVVMTVELACNFFNGLLDLSSGVTASAGVDNSLTLSASAGYDVVNGTEDMSNKNGTCAQGLEIKSDFVFDVTVFVTEWYSTSVYTYDYPLYDQCFTWESMA